MFDLIFNTIGLDIVLGVAVMAMVGSRCGALDDNGARFDFRQDPKLLT